jgi:hypothetical protein
VKAVVRSCVWWLCICASHCRPLIGCPRGSFYDEDRYLLDKCLAIESLCLLQPQFRTKDGVTVKAPVINVSMSVAAYSGLQELELLYCDHSPRQVVLPPLLKLQTVGVSSYFEDLKMNTGAACLGQNHLSIW